LWEYQKKEIDEKTAKIAQLLELKNQLESTIVQKDQTIDELKAEIVRLEQIKANNEATIKDAEKLAKEQEIKIDLRNKKIDRLCAQNSKKLNACLSFKKQVEVISKQRADLLD
jgi:chromosome segregation ATPase